MNAATPTHLVRLQCLRKIMLIFGYALTLYKLILLITHIDAPTSQQKVESNGSLQSDCIVSKVRFKTMVIGSTMQLYYGHNKDYS